MVLPSAIFKSIIKNKLVLVGQTSVLLDIGMFGSVNLNINFQIVEANA